MFYIKYYWILYIYCTSAGIFSLFLFIHKQCETAQEWAFYEFDNALEKEYDFIVVGGGSAGSIVAGRLAENPKDKVLLIEAGGEPSTVFDIPLASPLMQQSYADWKYITVSQEDACYGMINKQSRWPAGKIIGGTSRLNYMIYLRGHRYDYEKWEGHGNDWSFKDIFYYFKKSENFVGTKMSNDSNYHGKEGPVYVSDMKFRTILANKVLEAGEELGFKVLDLNDMMSSDGFMPVQVTGYNGARWSSDRALKQHLCKSRDNLKIITNTLVEKVLFKNGYEAVGVQFKRNGVNGVVKAKKSIVLSAGTLGTAKILLLSGIGPENHLLQHNIQPLVNLPVGDNLQDHVTTGVDLIIINETLPISSNAILKSPFEAYNYFINGKGVLTHAGSEVVGLFHVKKESTPDLQLMVIPAGISSDAGVILKKAMGISDKVWQEYFSPLVGEQVVSILPTLLHPKSRGYVRLKSSDPKDSLIINPKYLTHPYDIQILIKGLKLIQKLIKTKSFAKIGARLYDKSMPGCEKFNFSTEVYWECYVKHLTLTAYHPVGTCKMGHDDSSVVDYNLRVHQTNKLHVIDASIMPTMPSANINAAVMMIAEKGADLIKFIWHINKQSCHFMEIFISRTTTLA